MVGQRRTSQQPESPPKPAANSPGSKLDGETLEECRRIFDLIDVDKGGSLSAEEVHDALQRLGSDAITLEEAEAMVLEADEDGNGEIDYEEFCDLIAKMRNNSKSKWSWLSKLFKTPPSASPTKLMVNAHEGGSTPTKSGSSEKSGKLRKTRSAPAQTARKATTRAKTQLSVEIPNAVVQRLQMLLKARNAAALFKKRDTDGSGQLDASELKALFRRDLKVIPAELSDKVHGVPS